MVWTMSFWKFLKVKAKSLLLSAFHELAGILNSDILFQGPRLFHKKWHKARLFPNCFKMTFFF